MTPPSTTAQTAPDPPEQKAFIRKLVGHPPRLRASQCHSQARRVKRAQQAVGHAQERPTAATQNAGRGRSRGCRVARGDHIKRSEFRDAGGAPQHETVPRFVAQTPGSTAHVQSSGDSVGRVQVSNCWCVHPACQFLRWKLQVCTIRRETTQSHRRDCPSWSRLRLSQSTGWSLVWSYRSVSCHLQGCVFCGPLNICLIASMCSTFSVCSRCCSVIMMSITSCNLLWASFDASSSTVERTFKRYHSASVYFVCKTHDQARNRPTVLVVSRV